VIGRSGYDAARAPGCDEVHGGGSHHIDNRANLL